MPFFSYLRSRNTRAVSREKNQLFVRIRRYFLLPFVCADTDAEPQQKTMRNLNRVLAGSKGCATYATRAGARVGSRYCFFVCFRSSQ